MSIKGYKVFNPDWTCRGFQYEVGKTFKHDGKIEMCGAGFHFCRKLSDCFNYYRFDKNNKVAEVEAIGSVETQGDKSVTDEIVILKELSWMEVLEKANEGIECTGYGNSGGYNSGNYNSGDWNSGNYNSGDWNSGNYNSGNRNGGNRNSGNRNSGNYNSGDRNSGYRNSGDCNSGGYNSGGYNSGNWNSGYRNSGYRNSGDCNSGDCNSGNWNSGDWNSTDDSSGFFNSIEQPLYIFNKPAKISINEFRSLNIVKTMEYYFTVNKWVTKEIMTTEEKENHPEYETTGGYLKTFRYKEACANMWEKMTEEERDSVWDIPNFDPEVFFEITGIKVNPREVK